MTDAVIVSTARTPLCKSWRGALNMTHGAKLGGHVVHAALERWAADELRSVNAQIEFALRRALIESGRLPGAGA